MNKIISSVHEVKSRRITKFQPQSNSLIKNELDNSIILVDNNITNEDYFSGTVVHSGSSGLPLGNYNSKFSKYQHYTEFVGEVVLNSIVKQTPKKMLTTNYCKLTPVNKKSKFVPIKGDLVQSIDSKFIGEKIIVLVLSNTNDNECKFKGVVLYSEYKNRSIGYYSDLFVSSAFESYYGKLEIELESK